MSKRGERVLGVDGLESENALEERRPSRRLEKSIVWLYYLVLLGLFSLGGLVYWVVLVLMSPTPHQASPTEQRFAERTPFAERVLPWNMQVIKVAGKKVRAFAPQVVTPRPGSRATCLALYKRKMLRAAYKCYNAWSKGNPQDANARVWAGSLAGRIGLCNDVKKRNLALCYAAQRHYEAYLRIAPNGPLADKIQVALEGPATQ